MDTPNPHRRGERFRKHLTGAALKRLVAGDERCRLTGLDRSRHSFVVGRLGETLAVLEGGLQLPEAAR